MNVLKDMGGATMGAWEHYLPHLAKVGDWGSTHVTKSIF